MSEAPSPAESRWALPTRSRSTENIVRNINLDTFLLSALHLGKFGGHGVADGDIPSRVSCSVQRL